jgi:hypothetical protein
MRAMTSELYREPAKIYQFPLRGRFAGRGRLESMAAASLASPNLVAPSVVPGSGWYHEEAIREELARKD